MAKGEPRYTTQSRPMAACKAGITPPEVAQGADDLPSKVDPSLNNQGCYHMAGKQHPVSGGIKARLSAVPLILGVAAFIGLLWGPTWCCPAYGANARLTDALCLVDGEGEGECPEAPTLTPSVAPIITFCPLWCSSVTPVGPFYTKLARDWFGSCVLRQWGVGGGQGHIIPNIWRVCDRILGVVRSYTSEGEGECPEAPTLTPSVAPVITLFTLWCSSVTPVGPFYTKLGRDWFGSCVLRQWGVGGGQGHMIPRVLSGELLEQNQDQDTKKHLRGSCASEPERWGTRCKP